MATALGGFVAARLVVAHFGRPRLISPLQAVVRDTTIATGSSVGTSDPRDWIISDQTINAKGQMIGQFGSIGPSGNTTISVGTHGITIKGAGSCPNLHSQTPQNVQRCVDQLRIREVLTYQPISHYWALQLSLASLKGPGRCQKHGTTSRPHRPAYAMISATKAGVKRNGVAASKEPRLHRDR
jgi:hypothetical protein